MPKKMVFFDLDGTLLDKEKQLVRSAAEAVRTLNEKGIPVAIATGRAPFMFTMLRRQLRIDSYVSFNGQFVVSAGEVVLSNPLQRERLLALERKAAANGHPMVFLDDQTMKANHPGHPHIQESLAELRFTYPEVDETYPQLADVYQALLFCTEEQEPSYREGDQALDFIRWHRYSLDVIPAGGSKAKGIEALLKRFEVDQADVIAFGDGLNDIEMLRFAGIGVAMGNAQPETKAAADFVTKTVDEDGIVYGLKQLALL
ncbi:MAG TPA: Cof-type HAD-IIB family hydrolase [Bacillales bacterium]|nr:Cof-type HAD-IIB family hydrolase [Bacillales bacterium]